MSSDNTRFTGRVKWFNNQAGYGFITSRLGGEDERDVFVHHSSVSTQQDQFRYLVQGEYVSFAINESDDDSAEHRTTAQDVRGADGGMLMCETRLERRNSGPPRRPRGDSPDSHDRPRVAHRGRHPHSTRRDGPPRDGRGRRDDGVEWVLVRRRDESRPSRGRGGGGVRRGGPRNGPPRTHQPRVNSD